MFSRSFTLFTVTTLCRSITHTRAHTLVHTHTPGSKKQNCDLTSEKKKATSKSSIILILLGGISNTHTHTHTSHLVNRQEAQRIPTPSNYQVVYWYIIIPHGPALAKRKFS